MTLDTQFAIWVNCVFLQRKFSGALLEMEESETDRKEI